MGERFTHDEWVIAYETAFHQERRSTNIVHAQCLEDEIDRETQYANTREGK